MKKVLLLLMVLCVGGGVYWYFSGTTQENTQRITLYGNVDIHQVDLAFRVSGRIAEMLVEEGQAVQKGDVLAKLDTRPYEDEVRLAKADVTMQEASFSKLFTGYRPEEVQQARDTMREREVTVANLKVTLDRISKLQQGGAIPKQQEDDARARYQEAVARMEVARNQMELMEKGFREEDVNVQKAALEAANARLAKAQTALDDTTLYAQENGIVLTRSREKGAIVSAGQSVYTLSLVEPVHIRAYIAQPLLGHVKPGMEVDIFVDSMPNSVYKGHVGFIAPTAEFTPKSVETQEVRNDLVFRLRVIAEDPDNVMRQGIPVTIQLQRTQSGTGL